MKKVSTRNKIILLFLISLAFLSIFTYLIVRLSIFILQDYRWYERAFASLLLFSESFILIQTFGYFLNIFFVLRQSSKKQSSQPLDPLVNYPPVAIVVPSYKEPLEVLQDTLVCLYNLTYPNKHIYLLDDTRYELPWDTAENKEKYRQSIEDLCQWIGVNLFRSEWHGAKAGKINDFLQFLEGNSRSDFQFFPFEKKEKKEAEKYIVIFDADMNPIPDFVEEPIRIMENNPKIAFVQTPQYYTNFETNRVARASGMQQAIFFEYICEGKGTSNSMFCCGTNVLLRREALMGVGGFDEESVTEDFATSLKLHLKGWESIYINRVSAFGMGPNDLGGFFKQQFRWARGNIGILKKMPRQMFKNFNKISLLTWWEYILSCTHYFTGWVFFFMVIFPVAYLFFDVPSYFASGSVYLFIYVPYLILSFLVFFLTLKERRYRSSDLILSTLIGMIAFPVYIKATFNALFNIQTPFVITPKTGSTILSFRALLPQIMLNLLCFSAITWGLLRIIYEREQVSVLAISVFWTLYNFILMSFVLYFNHAEEKIAE